jgi:predicted metalloendopeptidase
MGLIFRPSGASHRRILFILGSLAVAVLGFSVRGSAQGAGQGAPARHGINPAYFDTTCAACSQFYQYANGSWLKTATIPPDYPEWGAFAAIYERSLVALRAALDSLPGSNPAPGTPEWKVAHFYASCMDSARAETDGSAPIKPELARIDSITGVPGLLAEIVRLHRMGVGPAFFFFAAPDAKHSSAVIANLAQGGLGLPDRDYYFRADTVAERTRHEYVAHIARTLVLTGVPAATAGREAQRIMALETGLATASMTIVEQRDPKAVYHKMTAAQLTALTPGWSWAVYFRDYGRPDIATINVRQPKFFTAFAHMVRATPIADWKSYLRWQYAAAAAPFLSSAFVKENFNMSSVLDGTTEIRPRWKQCLSQTDQQLGEALGKVYVAREFSPEAKAKALTLVQNLEAVLHDDLSTLAWMSEATRKQAQAKLDAFVNKIGYPDHWRDYSALAVRDGTFWSNVTAASEFEAHRQLMKIGGPTDRTEWAMTPPTVNAQYNPFLNDIMFPAGILQPPFFDPEADDASNYGAIGSIIGHEMTHGFDDEGRQFDAQGNLRDWWTPADAREYNKRAAIVVDQYNHNLVIDTLHLNGQQTLGENIADIGGLKLAYAAMQRALQGRPHALIDGFTPEQRFFLAYAQEWGEVDRPAYARTLVQVDVHSSPRWRVETPISNMPEFAQAFHCQATAALVRPDSARAQIW